MDGPPQTGPHRPTFQDVSTAPADSITEKKSKAGHKLSQPCYSENQRDFLDWPTSYPGYSGVLGHPVPASRLDAYSLGSGSGVGFTTFTASTARTWRPWRAMS